MRIFEKYFTCFIVNVLKVLLGALLLGTIGFMFYLATKINLSIILVIGFYSLANFGVFKVIKNKSFGLKYKIISIVFCRKNKIIRTKNI